jgi:hypothetical protein
MSPLYSAQLWMVSPFLLLEVFSSSTIISSLCSARRTRVALLACNSSLILFCSHKVYSCAFMPLHLIPPANTLNSNCAIFVLFLMLPLLGLSPIWRRPLRNGIPSMWPFV